MTQPFAWTFRDPVALERWTRWSLYAQIAVGVAALYSGQLEYHVLAGLQQGSFASEAQAIGAAEASDTRQGIVGMLQLVTMIVSGILILRWIHRANWNARALGARHLEFSPGMAIGWYFVPFLNLIKPYQAMKEIYQASTGAERWQGQPVSVLLGPWWALWLASSFAGNASFRLALKAEEVDALMTANRVTLVADLLSLPLCLVFLALMARIHAMQMRRHAAGAADHAAAPGDPLPAGQESAVAIEAGADPASNPASDIRD